MKSFIPNLLTLANLACGLLSVVSIFSSDYQQAAVLMVMSQVFDFFDGFAARLLKVHSELGKQLDSLADLVSFGVAPGFLVFKMFQMSYLSGEPTPDFLAYIALLIPLLSALRLGKFNIDTRQAEYFIGMPTPANALFWYSIGLLGIYTDNETVQNIILHPFMLTALTIVTSFLLVAELPLMSLKVKSLKWAENKGRYILIAGIVVMLAVFRFRALAFIIPYYLILSLIFKPNRN